MKAGQRLAAFVAETRFADIPPTVCRKALPPLVDGVAVTLGGWTAVGAALADLTAALGGRPEATVLGAGTKTAAPLAAYANGTMAHALDYDDINESMGGHPTAPVLPAVLALGEARGAGGDEMLRAYILGLETETKLGRAMIRGLYAGGWHPTAVLGTLGAAAAGSSLLGLDPEGTLMALGIAASSAGGLKQNFGTPTKPLHVGQAAKNGVLAAMLAQRGWKSDREALEGRFGFCNLFCGPGDCDPGAAADTLGNPWELDDPGVKLKRYPCCGSIHPALDAALSLTPVGAIETVTCAVHPSKTHILVHPAPANGLEAKFSIEYCLAAALTEGRVSLAHFQDAAVAAAPFGDLPGRVRAATDPSLPDWGARVTVTTADGRTAAAECRGLKGIDSPADLRGKFLDCAGPVLGRERAGRLLGVLETFDRLGGVGDLADLLAAK